MRSYLKVLAIAAVGLGHVSALHAPAGLSLHGRAPTTAAVLSAERLTARKAGVHAPAPRAPAAQPNLALRGGGEPALIGMVFALFKAIVGSGILSLPSAVAAWTDDKALLLPAAIASLILAVISAYSYSLIGQVCDMTGATTYQNAWERTVGKGTAWMPGFACTSQTLVACICYMIILGDLARDVAAACKVTGFFAKRENLLISLATLLVLPLCLLRSFAALTYTSMLGVMGVIYTAVFMTYRWLGGEYAAGGDFYHEMKAKPQFGSRFQPLKILILVATLNTAYHAHYDAPRFFHIMGNLKSFNTLTYSAFLAAGVISSLAMSAGFMTFGGASDGLILNSYGKSDTLALLGRVAIFASILFGYPLVFNGFRGNAFAMAGVSDPSQAAKDLFAIGVVGATTAIALVLTDLGFLASFAGAVLGSSIIFIFPAMMHIKAVNDLIAADEKLHIKKRKGIKRDTTYHLSYAIIALGSVLGSAGAGVSYLKSFTTVLD